MPKDAEDVLIEAVMVIQSIMHHDPELAEKIAEYVNETLQDTVEELKQKTVVRS